MVHSFGMMIVSWKSSQMHRAVWTPQFAAVVSCQNFESGVQCAVCWDKPKVDRPELIPVDRPIPADRPQLVQDDRPEKECKNPNVAVLPEPKEMW